MSWEIETPEGEVRAFGSARNAIVTVGLTDILDKYCRAGTNPAGFFIGLISNVPPSSYTVPTLAAGDTMSSHAGWNELTTNPGYSESVRQTWSPGAASAGVIINGTAARFTAALGTSTLSAVPVYGIFICAGSSGGGGTDADTKGGTADLLWCHAAFDSVQYLATGEVLKIQYELTAQSSS